MVSVKETARHAPPTNLTTRGSEKVRHHSQGNAKKKKVRGFLNAQAGKTRQLQRKAPESMGGLSQGKDSKSEKGE